MVIYVVIDKSKKIDEILNKCQFRNNYQKKLYFANLLYLNCNLLTINKKNLKSFDGKINYISTFTPNTEIGVNEFKIYNFSAMKITEDKFIPSYGITNNAIEFSKHGASFTTEVKVIKK